MTLPEHLREKAEKFASRYEGYLLDPMVDVSHAGDVAFVAAGDGFEAGVKARDEDVKKLVEALRFYAEEDNYETYEEVVRAPATTWCYETTKVKHDDGEIAREALRAFGDESSGALREQGSGEWEGE